MKILLALTLILITPYCLKAQGTTLGKTKEQIRAMIDPNNGIKLSKGDNADTLSMQGGLQIIMYYKNDICYSSKSVMPLAYKDMVVKKMTADSYKKVKENVWIHPSGTVKVEIVVFKEKNIFTAETSQVDNSAPN
jgi:hypothetical protein